MPLLRYWVTTRGLLAVGAWTFGVALTTGGMARLTVCALVASIAVVSVVVARKIRTDWFAGEHPESVGDRVGIAMSVADYTVILALAWIVPVHGLPGLGPLHAAHPSPVVLKVVVLLSVAHMWLRVARSGAPVRALEVLHPVTLIAAGLASWFIVDRNLPSGWGQEQAAFSIVAAALVVAWALAVQRLADRYERRDHRKLGAPGMA